ncbi:MAG: hypothetical protein CSB44_07410 [Gammaproteobacteria bacterium]|nr:MAG: hypothetical protein CSB44_07410 [Gammaproteobacteria bacterium]
MSLDALHAALYGDRPVRTGTLKSEISTLRRLLGGGIDSRPYRLVMDHRCDVIELWQALKHGNRERALQLYRGPLLPGSSSPELTEWRDCIDALTSELIENCANLDQLLTHAHATAGEQVRDRLRCLAG